MMNADLNFLIKEIDKYNTINEKTMIEEIKQKLDEKNHKIDNKNKNENTNTNVHTHINNNPNNIVNLNTQNDLRHHSETIASTSTCDSYSNIKNNTKEIIEKNIKKNTNEKKDIKHENKAQIEKDKNVFYTK